MKKILVILCAISMLLLSVSGCNVGEESAEIEEGYLSYETTVYEQVMEQAEVEPVDLSILYERIKQTVEELNQNSNLYLEMLSFANDYENFIPVTPAAIRESKPDESPRGGFSLRTESNHRIGRSEGLFDLFPRNSDDIRLTRLVWDTPGYFDVFGIDVGGNIEDAESILTQWGYAGREPRPFRQNYLTRNFGKERVAIILIVAAGDSEILEIRVVVGDPYRPTVPTHEMY